MSILKGPKFGNTHQTFLQDLAPILDQLKQNDSVKKIILGQIAPCRPSIARLKIQGISGSLLSFSFRGKTAIQQVAVACVDNQSAKNIWELLLEKFPIPKVQPNLTRIGKQQNPVLKKSINIQTPRIKVDGGKIYQNIINELQARKSVFRVVEDVKKKSRNKKREIVVTGDENFYLICKFTDYEWHRSFRVIIQDPVQKELLRNYILSIVFK